VFKRDILCLSLLWLVTPCPAYSQAMLENGGLYSSVTGLGAGLAASQHHGEVVKRSYQAVVRAEESALTQTRAIEQYMQLGCQYEAKKQWENAEKSFMCVLQFIARRDGPGSEKSVPALKHLVTVTKAQDKLADAISYQKTVVAFTKAARVPDYQTLVDQQVNLSNLFIQRQDYAGAEPVLREAVTVYDAHPSLPGKQRRATRASYAKLLRKLHKDSEAEAIEAADTDVEKPSSADQKTQSAIGNESKLPEGLATKHDDPLKGVDGKQEQAPAQKEDVTESAPVAPSTSKTTAAEQH